MTIEELYDKGLTYSEMGKEVGKNKNQIAAYLRDKYPDREPRSFEHRSLHSRINARKPRKRACTKRECG